MGGFLNSRFAMTIYMLAICAGSFFTTARGFEEYLPDAPSPVVWSLSGAFQILIYVTSSRIASASVGLTGKLGASVVFLLCLCVSSTGSFLYFDKIFTANERRRQTVQDYCDKVKLHFRATLESVSQRVTTYNAVSRLLKNAVEFESTQGFVSGRGQGDGNMTKLLKALEGSFKDPFDPDLNFVTNVESSCKFNFNDLSGLADENACKKALECFDVAAASLSSGAHQQQLDSEVKQVFQYIKKTKYGSELTVPLIPPFPDTRPKYDFPQPLSLFERISGAFTDLRGGISTTLFAFTLAVIIDFIVLILGLLRGETLSDSRLRRDSTIEKQGKGGSLQGNSSSAEEIINEFEKSHE